MGKSKKTRWRTLSFDGSKEETQTNGEVKANGTDAYINNNNSHNNSNSQKYSQILGDHHTNYSSQISNKSTSSTSSSHHQTIFKARNYNINKENFYNQRSGVKNNFAPRNSWQPRTFRSKDSYNKSEENAKSDAVKSDSNSTATATATEPIKFNEDEYTRITTPRQDVLFKKGYLSRMNSNNKTANNTSLTATTLATAISDSTGPNSTAATSDPESSLSVSTLSPSTTPSMDYGQADSIEYAAPMYYPGYYDESGMLVIPMYNGYNYYSPNGSSTTTSPVFLMPYPYQYDPFFMAPNTEVPVNGEEENVEEQEVKQETEDNESTEKDGEKENNQNVEEPNGARISSSSAEDAMTTSDVSSNHNEEIKNDEEKDEKQEQNEVTTNEFNEQTPKQSFPIYANELGYMYPTYTNGYYNSFYYYNGMPASARPPKNKRRKRFSSSRSSHSYPPPRSAETTTDYSDDEGGNSTHNSSNNNSVTHATSHNNHYHHHHHPNHKPYFMRNNHYHHQQNRWNYQHHNNNNGHHNGYNQYHYNAKYHKSHVDQNAHQTPLSATEATTVTDQEQPHNESNLNADVREFYPRVQSTTHVKESKCDVPAATTNDLQKQQPSAQQAKTAAIKTDAPPKIITNVNNIKTSQAVKSVGRVSKKDIISGIKSMEQQNINLVATSKVQLKSTTLTANDADVEWNVIKKGKKVKVVKDSHINNNNNNIHHNKSESMEMIKKDLPANDESKAKEVAMTTTVSQEIVNTNNNNNAKKTLPTANAATSHNNVKSKKSKSKNKKKKSYSMIKQNGFEIIEPEFGNSSNNDKEEITNDDDDYASDEEETVDEEILLEAINNYNEVIEEITHAITTKTDDVIIVESENKAELKEQHEEVFDRKQDEKEEIVVQAQTIIDEKIIEVQEQIEVLNVQNLSQNNSIKKINIISHDVDDDDAIIDISDEEICRKTSIEIDLSIAQEIAKIQVEVKEPIIVVETKVVEKVAVAVPAKQEEEQILGELNYFNDRKNIAALERDLMENLKVLDDGIDIKSPVINPLYDFPITSAVRKWLQEKQSESFDHLFRVENFKKLSELYDDCDDDESDISDSPLSKSETTDSDYASDIQVKLVNGSPASSNAKIDTKLTSKCNNKLIVKESFCALM